MDLPCCTCYVAELFFNNIAPSRLLQLDRQLKLNMQTVQNVRRQRITRHRYLWIFIHRR